MCERLLLKLVIIKNRIKPFLSATCYRPPSDTSNTLYKFENCLKPIDNEDKESIILGDINCDLLDNNPTSLISELKFITNLYQYEHRKTRLSLHPAFARARLNYPLK